ncbi:MAG: DUF92 domain-containing protein [Terracidiphilus sp.]
MAHETLTWQSKLVLLAVLPFAGTEVLLECWGWAGETASVALWTIGLSALLGLLTWNLRATTPGGAAAGALITASLMFSTIAPPFEPWHTAVIPTLAVSLLAFAATLAGRQKKEWMGTAEARRGRSAAQIVANLGIAAMAASGPVQAGLMDSSWLPRTLHTPKLALVLALAALAEAAADTVSSEIGQVLGGRPRMITTLRAVEPGRDGAISAVGTLAGVLAAAIVAGAGTWALRGDWNLLWMSCAGGVFGLFFDSLLGATAEQWGWLNNDLVNFLSTASAAGCAMGLMAALR